MASRRSFSPAFSSASSRWVAMAWICRSTRPVAMTMRSVKEARPVTSSTWMSSALSSSRRGAGGGDQRIDPVRRRMGPGRACRACLSGPAADRALVLIAAARRGRRGAAGASAWGSPTRAFGVRAMGASCFSRSSILPRAAAARAARMAVADAGCSGAGIRHQGACAPCAPRSNASRDAGGGVRASRAACPASARRVAPGRGTTAMGVVRAISRQRRQRGSCSRLSAPSSSAKRTRGKRRRSSARVSAV